MKKFTKIIALVLALVCICTAFAACGGNKDDGNTLSMSFRNLIGESPIGIRLPDQVRQ